MFLFLDEIKTTTAILHKIFYDIHIGSCIVCSHCFSGECTVKARIAAILCNKMCIFGSNDAFWVIMTATWNHTLTQKLTSWCPPAFLLMALWLELNNRLCLLVTLDCLHGNCCFIERDRFLGLRSAETDKQIRKIKLCVILCILTTVGCILFSLQFVGANITDKITKMALHV